MGGAVITQAAANCPERVASMIFVCAFMPADGQSLLDLTHLPEGKDDMIQANLVIEGDPPVAVLSNDATARAIYNRCTEEQRAWAVARRRPQPVAPFADPVHVDEGVLASIPRSYVVTKHDNSIPPALQRRMIREHPCASVVELDADHAPFLSATDELVAALAALAEDTVAAAGTAWPDNYCAGGGGPGRPHLDRAREVARARAPGAASSCSSAASAATGASGSSTRTDGCSTTSATARW